MDSRRVALMLRSMQLPPPTDGIHTLRNGTPEYAAHVPPVVGCFAENAMVFKCSQCDYLCKNWDRARIHYCSVHVMNGRSLPSRWKLSSMAGDSQNAQASRNLSEQYNECVVTYVRGTPECKAAVPADILEAMGSGQTHIYKCAMCPFFKDRKSHVGNHYMRIHVLNGTPVMGRRKFPVGDADTKSNRRQKKKQDAITGSFSVVSSSRRVRRCLRDKPEKSADDEWTPSKNNASSDKGVARALEFPAALKASVPAPAPEKKPAYKPLLRIRPRTSSPPQPVDKDADAEKKQWTFPSLEGGQKFIFYGEWNQGCRTVNDYFASLLPTPPATPRHQENDEAAEEQETADSVVLLSSDDKYEEAWGEWTNDHSGFMFDSVTTSNPTASSDFMDMDWDMLPNAFY